jgi:hypothetical protein
MLHHILYKGYSQTHTDNFFVKVLIKLLILLFFLLVLAFETIDNLIWY